MKRIDKRTRSPRLLFLLAISWTFWTGCPTTNGPAELRCPLPSALERFDYSKIIVEDAGARDLETTQPRPAVQWVGRLVAYCWSDEAAAVRRGS